MKKVTLSFLFIVLSLCGNAQRRSIEKYFHVMPYGGYASNWTNSNTQAFESMQVDEVVYQNWSSMDDLALDMQNTTYEISANPFFGLEAGFGLDYPVRDWKFQSIFNVSVEYGSRSYTGVQQYNNGIITGVRTLTGDESRGVVRVSGLQNFGRFGVQVGVWTCISKYSNQNVQFRGYQDGNLVYQKQLLPFTQALGYDPAYQWYDNKFGLGFQIGAQVQITDYVRLFCRYEVSYIRFTQVYDSWEILFSPSNGVFVNTAYLGVGIPFKFH